MATASGPRWVRADHRDAFTAREGAGLLRSRRAFPKTRLPLVLRQEIRMMLTPAESYIGADPVSNGGFHAKNIPDNAGRDRNGSFRRYASLRSVGASCARE